MGAAGREKRHLRVLSAVGMVPGAYAPMMRARSPTDYRRGRPARATGARGTRRSTTSTSQPGTTRSQRRTRSR
ncbi:hypothetical protein MTX80_15445 [Gordonia amicalis]|nr:hypothetical protein [Gordonia amicalis]UOG20523.1 hypothetical protein MTX80_15445 [Gordonia amicalis]